jgi:bifunctional DNA-binding transcriptional regulator/antitoxin component of YhaV-PrlF toxin-antitoxin module
MNKRGFTRKEIAELIKESETDYIEAINTISSDGRNLVVRIPKEIRDYMKIKKGQRMRFYIKTSGKKKYPLEVSILK